MVRSINELRNIFELLFWSLIMSEENKKEFTFPRKLRVCSDNIAFSIPKTLVPLLKDETRGKTWIVTIREA